MVDRSADPIGQPRFALLNLHRRSWSELAAIATRLHEREGSERTAQSDEALTHKWCRTVRRRMYNPALREGELHMPSRISRALIVCVAASVVAVFIGVVHAQGPAALRWVKAAPFPEPEEELYAVT